VTSLDAETSATVPCWICAGPSRLLEAYRPLALFHCPRCELVFQPLLASDEIRDAYDATYFENYGFGYRYDDGGQRQREARMRLDLIARWATPGRLLEIGSAAGIFLSAAHARGWEAEGIEPCESVAVQARQRGTRTQIGFVEDIPLEPQSYDVVCGWHVLEHIPNPLPALQKLRLALRLGGVAIFEVPNFGGTRSRREGPAWPYLDPGHHVNQFSPASIQALFEAAAFDVSRVTTVPMGVYGPRSDLLKPRPLLRRVRNGARTRTLGFGSHRSRFDLLRVVARSRS
jgi:2-polyprenyl-3-methyl-5-hydroxy-6-metoxy-1,4-benzoquinol methylase